MGLSLDQLTQIKEEFEQKYIFSEPYNEYVIGCGISKLQVMKDVAKNRNIDLKENESLEDLCLYVMLKKTPKDLEFPSEYKGFRVFYRVVGKIKPL